MKLEERFWSKVQKMDGCWQWKAQLFPNGYGSFLFRGRKVKAHRIVWKLTYGEIPEGMKVCHHCDNRACMNPEHLFLGTQRDNIRDMMAKGRSSTVGAPQIGEANRNARLTQEQVQTIRNSALRGKTLAELYSISLSQIYKRKPSLGCWSVKYENKIDRNSSD